MLQRKFVLMMMLLLRPALALDLALALALELELAFAIALSPALIKRQISTGNNSFLCNDINGGTTC